jgi:hypothetical protein
MKTTPYYKEKVELIVYFKKRNKKRFLAAMHGGAESEPARVRPSRTKYNHNSKKNEGLKTIHTTLLLPQFFM